MRIRFVDAEEWDNPIFWKLSSLAKLVRYYITCKSQAGFVKIDFDHLTVLLNEEKGRVEAAVKELCGTSNNGVPLYLLRKGILYATDYTATQDQGMLSITNPAHIGTIKTIMEMSRWFPEAEKYLPANPKEMLEEIKGRLSSIRANNVRSMYLRLIDFITRFITEREASRQTELFPDDGDVPSIIGEGLAILKAVKNYPYNKTRDIQNLAEILKDHGSERFLGELKKKATYWLDHPIKKSSNVRLQLKNWFDLARKFRKESEDKKQKGLKEARAHKAGLDKKNEAYRREEEETQRALREEEKWSNKHLDEKDIPAWEIRYKTARGPAIWFLNRARERAGMPALPGEVPPLSGKL